MLPLFISYLLRQECHKQPCHNGKATLVQQASKAKGLVGGYNKPLTLVETHQYKWMDSTELCLQKELAQTRVSQSETLGFRRLYHQTASSPGGSEQPDVVQDSSMCPDVLIVLQN